MDNTVQPVDDYGYSADSAMPEDLGLLGRCWQHISGWLEVIGDTWQDFCKDNHDWARAVEIFCLLIKLVLYVYDITTDIIVVKQLFASGYMQYAALSLLFSLLAYPVMAVLLLYFLQPMAIIAPDSGKGSVAASTWKSGWGGHLQRLAFLPISLWMVPALDVYMLLLPIVVDRNRSDALMRKIMGFMDSYGQARLPLHNLLQSLPQMFLQLSIYVRIAHGTGGPDVSLFSLLLSILASSLSLIMYIIIICLSAHTSKLGWRYFWDLCTLKGAASLHATDDNALYNRLEQHKGDTGFAPLVLSRAEGTGDDVLPRLVRAQVAGTMRFIGRRLMLDMRQVELRMLVPDALHMLEELEKHAVRQREAASSSQATASPPPSQHHCCITITSLIKRGAGTTTSQASGPTFVSILAMPPAPTLAAGKGRPTAWSIPRLLRCFPQLQELHLGPGTYIDLHLLLPGKWAEGGSVQLVLDCCSVQPRAVIDDRLGFKGLLLSGRFDKIVLLTHEAALVEEASAAAGAVNDKKLVIFSGEATATAAAMVAMATPNLLLAPFPTHSHPSVVTCCSRMRPLDSIALAGSHLSLSDAKALAVALRLRTSVTELDLRNNLLDPLAVKALVVSPLPGLRRLVLSDNTGIKDAGAKYLAVAVSNGRLPQLEELGLDNVGIMQPATATSLLDLVFDLRFLKGTQHLKLTMNDSGLFESSWWSAAADGHIDTYAMAMLESAVSGAPVHHQEPNIRKQWQKSVGDSGSSGDRVSDISGDGTSVTARSGQELAVAALASLQQGPATATATMITITVPKAQKAGAGLMSRCMATLIVGHGRSLQRLSIAGMDLSGAKARELLAAVVSQAACPNLQHLDVRSNGLGDAGAKALAEVARASTSLRHLDLSSNGISLSAACDFIDTLITRLTLPPWTLPTHIPLPPLPTHLPPPPLPIRLPPPSVSTPLPLPPLPTHLRPPPLPNHCVRHQLQHIGLMGLCSRTASFCLAGIAKTRRSLEIQRILDGVCLAQPNMLYTLYNRQPDQPEVSPSQPDQPEVSQSQPDQPEVSQSQPDQPEVSQSQPDQPEVSPSQPDQPEVSQSQPDQPEVSQSQTWIDTTTWNLSYAEGPNLTTALQRLHLHTDIRHLTLSGNQMAGDVLRALFTWAESATSLEHLGLERCNIGGALMSHLADALQSKNSIKQLDLRGNDIGGEGARNLARGMQASASLQHLDLSDNSIGDKGAQELAEGVKACASLKHLELRNNEIGDDGAEALAEGIKGSASLQHLNLCDNKIGYQGALALAEGVKACSRLQHLNLGDNKIGDQGALALAEGIRTSISLQHLDLSRNAIGDEGVQAIAGSMQVSVSLQHLDLSCNHIDGQGDWAQALAVGLEASSSLQCLNLSSNGIGIVDKGDVALQALARGMQASASLQRLDLSSNEIGDEGAKALAKGVEACVSLQHLNLSDNHIDDEGAEALAEGIKGGASRGGGGGLQHLDLRYNRIDVDGAMALAKACQQCTCLQSLDLGQNEFAYDGEILDQDLEDVLSELDNIIDWF